MKKLTLILLNLLLINSIYAVEGQFDILLKSGTYSPAPLSASSTLNSVWSNHSTNGYAIVQFKSIPTESEKELLASNGIVLLEFLPENSFLCYANQTGNGSLASLKIRSILAYSPSIKIHQEILNGFIPEYMEIENDLIAVSIDRQLNASIMDLENALINLGAEISLRSSNGEYLTVILDKNKLLDIAAIPAVKFIGYSEAPPVKEDTRGRSLHRGNMLDSDHPLGKKYDGSGVSLAIADDGEIGPHIDTKGRVTSFASPSTGTHGDMTTGIAMGAGNVDPRYRGMATDAYLYYYSIGGYPHITQAITNLNTRGVVVTSTSYSEGCNAGYTTTTREVDQQTRTNPSLLHVFSAGNSAGSTCGSNSYGAGTPWGTITGGRKQGKAAIATGNLEYTGALTASSSRGPAKDGRIKPDICANGTNQMSTDPNNTYSPGGGTSAAAPGIAGLAVQMYDGYRQLNGGSNPESALIKSAMLNTARDIGNPGPDFFYGWGRVNAHRAMKLIEENRYLSANISQSQNNSHTITLANPLQRLNVMVYWTDYEASTSAAKDLVNDIDIQVITPNGDTILPWVLDHTPNATALSSNAVKGVDHRNNMEQVSIDAAAAGTYTVLVNGFAIPQGPQKYYLSWETRPDEIEVTYPSGGEGFVPGETETIRWDAYGNSGTFNIDFSADSGATWTSIATNVQGSARYRNWAVPSSVTGKGMIRVTRGSVSGQSALPFSIIGLPNLSVQYTCPDSILFTWPTVGGANSYELYQLGAKHMDSIYRGTGNSVKIYNINLSDDNWFALKALNTATGITGRRSNAIILPKTPLNCPLAYDMRIFQINSPSGGTLSSCGTGKLGVQITINNNGDSVLTNIPLRLVANNVTYYDTIPGPLPSKSFSFFYFSDSIPLTAGPLNLRVVSDLANDQNHNNDSLSTNINVTGGQIFTIPYYNDFESFGICGTNTDCGGTNCLLNGGWVNATNGVDDVFDMRVNTGGTASANTGPTTDHNPGTASGKYIYSEASNNCYGVQSIVYSPCFDLTGAIQPEMSFWYHMYGSNMGILRVDVLADGNWNSNVITPLFGNIGNAWNQQLVDLSSYAGKQITVRFRIQTGSGFASDLALDDFSIIDQSTSISESKNAEFSLFPNPSEGLVNLKFNTSENRMIEVFDIQGKRVYQKIHNNSIAELNLSHLNKGLYFIAVQGKAGRAKVILH